MKPGEVGFGQAWLIDRIKKRLHEQRLNAIVFLVGAPGSGKSWTAGSFAEAIDPAFNVKERVVFTAHDFLKVIQEKLPIGSAILWDEAGVGLAAREFMSVLNRTISLVLQSFRVKRYALFLTLPGFAMADLHARALAHFLLECKGVEKDRVRVRPFLVSHDPTRGKVYMKFPRVHPKGLPRHIEREILVSGPSPRFQEEYETKRGAFLTDLYAELLARTEKKAAPKREGRPDMDPRLKHTVLDIHERWPEMSQSEIGRITNLAPAQVGRILKGKGFLKPPQPPGT